MESADHVYLSDSQSERFFDCGDDLVDGAFERMGIPLFRGERAKLAGEDANIGIVYVTIQNVGGDVAIFPCAHSSRHHAEGV